MTDEIEGSGFGRRRGDLMTVTPGNLDDGPVYKAARGPLRNVDDSDWVDQLWEDVRFRPTPQNAFWVRGWGEVEVQGYRNWVAKNALSWVGKPAFKRDCADWTVFCLYQYARSKSLNINQTAPLHFLPILKRNPNVNSFSQSKLYELTNQDPWDVAEDSSYHLRATHLADLSLKNCVGVPDVRSLLPGDLITEGEHHVQLVISNGTFINAPEGRDIGGKNGVKAEVKKFRVVEITQGNLVDDPQGSGKKVGTPIVHAAWNLDGPQYWKKRDGNWKFDGAKNLVGNLKAAGDDITNGYHLRRWNFANFNL